jgi:pimeloyl-ACP methyl ester carboxylesterase
MPANHVNVVLAHGAWADGSSWSKVIGPLKAAGTKVVAAPLPFTSLADDIAAVERVLERLDGPVVLAGHAYAGAVINPETQLFQAERMGARVRTRPVDHIPMITAPADVVDIILDAAGDVAPAAS